MVIAARCRFSPEELHERRSRRTAASSSLMRARMLAVGEIWNSQASVREKSAPLRCSECSVFGSNQPRALFGDHHGYPWAQWRNRDD